MTKLVIWAKHPIMYQTPIFKSLNKFIKSNNLVMSLKILFGDNLSLKKVYFKEIGTEFMPDFKDLLTGYDFQFLKNYSFDSKSGFFSRFNLGIFYYFFKNKPDIVLVHGYETATTWMILFLSFFFRFKIIWRGESIIRRVNSKSFKNKIKEIVLNLFFSRCDAVLYSCSGNKLYLEQYNSIDKMFFIPCAVNNDFFQKEKSYFSSRLNDVKSDLDIDKDDLVVLFSARFTSRKRPLDLLKALTLIDNKKIVVLFVGDGPEKSKMQQYSLKHNIKTVFTGFVNQTQISKYYSISDLDIVISDYDPSPKSMNEAMNFDLPIITTNDVGTSLDLVKNGVNGFIIDTGDIINLSKKINFFNLDRKQTVIMGKKSGEIVQKWNYNENSIGIIDAINFLKKKSS